ncbi:helix-turn-helix domain-containing protein [Pedobacter nutrimenti]|jgi:DNA-binding CsgD family transcriptional regulator|uniref:Regulatory LuxR family protein n=1 Tax=Pedobacter nutrimenti TaxID=1241337 RepID=A0A318UG81_9SPHI|nr:helix-turn-helix transcriptional regulator [Pedobacter nutrimenti]PYF74377.1 regulatory LuxR family protein [Pedobacter nutrimenti]
MNIFESDTIALNYQDEGNLLTASWKNCTNAEQFTDGIKSCRELCDKVDLQNTLWHFNEFSYVIPPDLQKWTDTFLNVSVLKKSKNFRNVAFIVGNDVLALLSAIDTAENGESGVKPRYFGSEQQALKYLLTRNKEKKELSRTLLMPDLSFKTDSNNPDRSQIRIDVNSEEIHQYLFLLNRMLKSRSFGIQHVSKFMMLSVREKEILNMILNGLTNEKIAQLLYITYETVKTHRKNIFRKLECRNLRELMQYNILFPSPGSFL